MPYTKSRCRSCGDPVVIGWYQLCWDCYNETVNGVVPPVERVNVNFLGGRSDPVQATEIRYNGKGTE